VVGTCFWEAIRAIDKLVEFRTPHQLIEFIPGLRLLFSLNAIERKQGRTDLIEAAVLEIVTLSCEEAYARFSREAQACDLESRCAKWRSKSVQCLVLDPDSIGVARDIQHLSVGNHGVLRQIDDTNRIARFCRSDQLGTTETVHLSTGESVSCTYTRTWPKYPDAEISGRAAGGPPPPHRQPPLPTPPPTPGPLIRPPLEMRCRGLLLLRRILNACLCCPRSQTIGTSVSFAIG
jgi:hypothetical protein